MDTPNLLKDNFLEKIEKLFNFYGMSQSAISRQTGISVDKIRNARINRPYKVTRAEILKLDKLIEEQESPNQPEKPEDEARFEELERIAKEQQEEINELKKKLNKVLEVLPTDIKL